jgi:hypothetical protein
VNETVINLFLFIFLNGLLSRHNEILNLRIRVHLIQLLRYELLITEVHLMLN